jgi:ankyrin repeat protein
MQERTVEALLILSQGLELAANDLFIPKSGVAEIGRQNAAGITPLHLGLHEWQVSFTSIWPFLSVAAMSGSATMLHALLQTLKQKTSVADRLAVINRRNKDGATALFAASERGNLANVELLLGESAG